ncbi:MAG: tetraacyldisaccharide 4'-kinase [Fimbriiglobus sp.]
MAGRDERFHAIIRGQARGLTPSLLRAGLWWARWPYGLGAMVRNTLFDVGWKKAVSVPGVVISVGNLTLGGTGKTPCVEALAEFLRTEGYATAILSRGYGSDSGPNDEAMVLEENLPDVPHLQSRDRVEIAMTAIQELESEVLLLDDGFQHRRLKRNLDIVLIDASRPLTSEYLFPRGTLREPLSSLARADVFILTRCEQVTAQSLEAQKNWLISRHPTKPVVLAEHTVVELANETGTLPSEQLRGVPVVGFCGLANPQAFRQTLTDLGADVLDLVTFPDHHAYTREDVERIAQRLSSLPAHGLGVTSQKDYVKLRTPELGGRAVWAVRIGMSFRENEAALHAKLREVLPPRSDE